MTWSSTEIGVLARAVSHAPSVHNTQPWTMEARAESAELYERFDVTLPHHDPTGRDRLISCGAALANLELAVRALGWAADISLFPDAGHPDLVAVVGTAGRKETTAAEVERYAAIFRRHSHRHPFDLHPVSRGALRGLAGVVNEPGVQARVVDPRTECATLAELFDYAAEVLRDDRGYQRELASWSDGPADTTLPWGGLVRADTHVPDTVTLTERLMREGILMLLTPDDTRRDHLLAGVAMQQIWLAAITRGMVASVLTQPLHLHEVRSALIERLGLAGYPQLFLRLGHPAQAGHEVPSAEDERQLSPTPASS
ncbi:Acg family FMN-binding oxidoreductase [Amycolatopsis pigmentata]|uniref:Acg family FMN-binding oxidoreductase n=1 Tax=Amycolatopsis pigmentata TaxID=450801 RepID=A0ABW5FXZ8_9PSEU